MDKTPRNAVAHDPHVTRTPEERAEHRRQYLTQYMRRYRAQHPAQTLAWRIQAAINLLQRAGYNVTPPDAKGGESE